MTQRFNIMIVGQAGRLAYEALLFAASLRAMSPGFEGRLVVAEPQPGPLWPRDPRIPEGELRNALLEHGAEILPFESLHFGAAYPLWQQDRGVGDASCGRTLRLLRYRTRSSPARCRGVPFDFGRPTASRRCEGTWPVLELYGPGYDEIWGALYRRFGLDFESSLDLAQPDGYWRRYLYFNAGWFFHACPEVFGARFLDTAIGIPGPSAGRARVSAARPLARPDRAAARDPRPGRRAGDAARRPS